MQLNNINLVQIYFALHLIGTRVIEVNRTKFIGSNQFVKFEIVIELIIIF